MPIESFMRLVQAQTSTETLFNPWTTCDPLHDAHADAAGVRTDQLSAYLAQRQGRARLILLAEGLSYQGGKFSGIAMTSERILLGAKEGIAPEAVFRGEKRQTSNRPGGFNEPTASIVWSTLLGAGLDPYSWVNWNAFPWHPHLAGNLLSNRAPTAAELTAAVPVWEDMRALFPEARVVAVGATSSRLLGQLGVTHEKVRHPARGGATEFRAQILALLS